MNPAVVIGLIAIGAIAWTMLKSANTVTSLYYNVVKFGIYNFVKGNKLVFRLVVRFTNPTNTPLHINLVNLTAYLNSQFTTDNAGNVTIISRGTQIANIADNQPWIIAANNFTERQFLIECGWLNIARVLLGEISDNGGFDGLIDVLLGKPVLVDGVISGEGVKVPITTVIAITND